MKFSLILAAWFFFCSLPDGLSQSRPLSIPVSMTAGKQALNVSRFMDIDKIVPLQTTMENLLPGYNVPIVMARGYILVLEDKKGIHQYSADGKFIRFLAKAGKGPNEFQFIQAYAVDAAKNIFYYVHGGDPSHIQALDLVQGKPLGRILFPLAEVSKTGSNPYLRNIVVMDSNTLACVTANSREMVYAVFYINTSGKFLKGFRYEKEQDDVPVTYSAMKLNKDLHLMVNHVQSFENTLFGVAESMQPYAEFDIRPDGLAADESVAMSIPVEGPGTLVIRILKITIKTMSGGGQMATPQVSDFFVDKKTRTSFPVSEYHVDYLGGVKATSFFMNGNTGITKIGAPEFRAQARAILETENLTPEVRTRMQKLMSQVSDEDNPIVLFGRLK